MPEWDGRLRLMHGIGKSRRLNNCLIIQLYIHFRRRFFPAARTMLNWGVNENGAGGKKMSRHTVKADCQLQILQIVHSTPDVRQDKVKKLKKRIRQNSYKVDADRLAEKMLEEALMDKLYAAGRKFN
jgi:flagellar biosynthesis anti-sigma factor FlgM